MEYVIHRRKENKTQWLNSEGKWTSEAKEAGQFNKRTANNKANLLNAKTFDYDAIKRLADSEKEWDIFIVDDYEEFIEIENLNKNIKRCIAYETNDLMLKTKMYFYWIGE